MAGIMAASAPPADLPAGWSKAQLSDPTGTSGLEIGFSGMSLLPSGGGSRSSQLSLEEHNHYGNVNSGDSVHSHHSAASSKGGHSGMSRPPGLNLSSNVQPIGKPGHAKSASTSSTAHTATLTPTSSLDGGASNDLFGMGRQTSPSSDHLPGISNLGSFDTDDGEHDGLLGLQALRDRAYSSPGPVMPGAFYSTSPREVSSMRNVISQHGGRPRTVSKDSGRPQGLSRPPLAGGSALSPHTDGFGYPGNRSRDASPPPNAGVISRPEMQYSPYGGSVGGGTEGFDRNLDTSLRRALSTDSANEYGKDPFGGGHGGEHHLSSKFSPLPFPQQQRVTHQQQLGGNLQGHGFYQRHHRSLSQPGPGKASYNPDAFLDEVATLHRRGSEYGGTGYMHHRTGTPGLDVDYGVLQQHDMRYHPLETHHQAHHGRSLSMQHPGSQTDVIHDLQHRSSAGYFGGHLQRRDGEYGGHEDPRVYQNVEQERIGSTNYARQDRFVSPAHSPLVVNYGHHSRQSSDMGSTVSSSPMSLTSGTLYGRHHPSQHSDEDLSHPLVGENIEVPGDEQFFMNEGISIYPRSSSMGHVASYGVDSHLTANEGAAMAPPKLVYNVKFKRTQRTFEIGPRLNRDLKVGTYVKVEADRGEDLGIVVGKVRNTAVRSASLGGGMADMAGAPGAPVTDSKKIIRLATHDEVSLLQLKREEEDELLKVCRTKARQRGLAMNVVDAEYQFDRHKLTFFFEAEGRIDFRELVRDLFSIYKTRIWMQQLDKNTAATCPAAPAPAPLVMDYGTPIIAPASEYQEYAGGLDEGSD